MHGPIDFVPPLITDGSVVPALRRWRDAILTALLWAFWAYLIVAAVGAVWVPPYVHRMLPVRAPADPWVIPLTVLMCVGVAAFMVGMVLSRVMRERALYGGEDRRRASAKPDDAVLATEFGVPARDLPAWRAARAIVVHYDDAGHIVQVETDEALPLAA